MKRALFLTVASLCLVVMPAAATVSTVDAAVPRKAAVCPKLKTAGTTLQWSVVGTGWTCSSAKKWVVKLVGEKQTGTGAVTFTDGPKRYHCKGTADDSGHATLGACYLGTLAFPKSGFQWFG